MVDISARDVNRQAEDEVLDAHIRQRSAGRDQVGGRHGAGRQIDQRLRAGRGRSTIEQCVGWLKECRAVATRYEKLALNYLGLVKLAFIERYLRLLTRAAIA
jgi:hypothetical protein